MDHPPPDMPDHPPPTSTDHVNHAPDAGAGSDDAPPLDVKPRPEQPPAAPSATSPAASATPSAPLTDGEEILYHGSVSLWLGWRSIVSATGAVLLGLGLLIAGWINGGWLRSLGIYVGIPLAVAGAIMFGYVYLSLRCLRYKITNRLIERERGILVKRVDSLDLGRIKDVELVQNLMERILRIGTIEILSSDRTDPLMRLEAIPAPRPVYEKLRDIVIRISQKRGIIAMDR